MPGGYSSSVVHDCGVGAKVVRGACTCNGCAVDNSLPDGKGGWFCVTTPDPNAVESWVHLNLTCEPL